jgi:glycosyltransferase involved in cell wall biosynthesis
MASSTANPRPRRILLLTPFPPKCDGFHGGSQAIGRFVKELVDLHSVAVVYLRAKGEPPMEPELVARCATVEEVPRPNSGYVRLLGAWARGYPMWVEDWRVPAFRESMRKLVAQWRPDVVQFEFHTMAQYLDDSRQYRSILVEHEPGAAAARDRWQLSTGWRRLLLARDMRSWENYERKILPKFDAVVCFTDLDRRKLQELAPVTRMEVIAPAGPPCTGSRPPGVESANTILFIGSFIHPPNVDAAIRLAEGILPRVRVGHPDAVLQLVGDAPPASIRRLAGPGVEVTGRVPDVAPFLDEATVVAVPLRMGGGMRIKVLDALAFGKAIVATPLAVEGLNLHDGRELVLAGSDEDFAVAIGELLSNAPLRQRFSENARAWAVQFGAPGRVGAAFERLYGELQMA